MRRIKTAFTDLPPEELFYISNFLIEEIQDSKHLELLHNKMVADYEHIEKVLDSLEKQLDVASAANPLHDSDDDLRFDITADMAEGIHLSRKQIELWEKIIERKRLLVIAAKN